MFPRSTQSFHRDQLFSTRPRLARSGSKTKLDRSQLPPTDPALSSRTHNSNNNNNHHPDSHRSVTNTNSYVEIIGKGYTEEKHSPKSNTTETMDDKASSVSKSRAKIIRGKIFTGAKGDDVFESIDDQQWFLLKWKNTICRSADFGGTISGKCAFLLRTDSAGDLIDEYRTSLSRLANNFLVVVVTKIQWYISDFFVWVHYRPRWMNPRWWRCSRS